MKYMRASDGVWTEAAGYSKKRLLDENDLAQAGALVQLVQIEPGNVVKRHLHRTSYEVFHVVQGECIMTIAGNEIVLRPGDTATTSPGEIHDARNEGDVPFRMVVFKTNVSPNDSVWLDS